MAGPSAWDGTRRRAILDANSRSLIPMLAPLLIWLTAWAHLGPAALRGIGCAVVAAWLTASAAARIVAHQHLAGRPRAGRFDATLLLRVALLTAGAELGAVLVTAAVWTTLRPALPLMLVGAAVAACVAALALAMDDVLRLAYPLIALLPPAGAVLVIDPAGAAGVLGLLLALGILLLALSRRLRDDYWETASLGAEQRSRNHELEQLSSTDALTGVANRLGFDRRLAAEWHGARTAGGFVTVMMVDLDHFKDVNDRYGHPVGDRCLRETAMTIVAQLEIEEAFTARYGGEEFVVLLPGAGRPAALAVAERLRAAIEATVVGDDGLLPPIRLSCSIGVATVAPTRAAGGPEAIIAEADTALYRAKRGGRNRVCAADIAKAVS